MPEIITTPTYLLDDVDLAQVLAKVDEVNSNGVREEVASLVQAAFEAGMGVNTPRPVEKPVEAVAAPVSTGSGKVPHYRTWAEIDEDGALNPVEVFVYRDSPNPADETINIEGWNARFLAALKYAVKH